MKLSSIFLPTIKETPSDEHKVEKQLLIRAAMERKLSFGAGVRLPLGEIQLDHISKVIRKELSFINPQEIALFNMEEQVGELAVTELIKNELKSYKQLPKTLITGRENVNIYSFDSIEENAQGGTHLELIKTALNKLSLEYKITEDGEIYGMNTGNEAIVYCPSCGYAMAQDWANTYLNIENGDTQKEISEEYTPNAGTIEELMDFYKKDGYAFAKSLLIGVKDEVILAIVPGPKDLSMKKLAKHLGVKEDELGLISDEQVREITGAECGFAGPIGLKKDIKIYMDKRLAKRANLYVGANKTDYHLGNVNYGRDFQAELVDCLIEVGGADACPTCKANLISTKARLLAKQIELGSDYNKKLYVEYLDNKGKAQKAKLTVTKIDQVAIMEAIIAQNHDEKGIVYKEGQGAFDAIITIVNIKNEDQLNLANSLQTALEEKGKTVLVDDRDERAGMKFADAELIGINHQITVGKLAGEGKVEYCQRSKEKQTLEVAELLEII